MRTSKIPIKITDHASHVSIVKYGSTSYFFGMLYPLGNLKGKQSIWWKFLFVRASKSIKLVLIGAIQKIRNALGG